MTSQLPGIGDPATLRVAGQEASYAVQVQGTEDTDLVIAAPMVAADIFAVRGQALFELEWFSARGVLTTPVRWVGAYRGQGSLWQLEVCGPITTSQRRRFARASLSLPGTVYIGSAYKAGAPDLNTATALDATLLDLSEAGLRLVLPQGGRYTAALTAGERIIVEVILLGETLVLPGEVLNAVRIVPPGGEALRIVVVLDDPGPVGTLLRKAVLQTQVEARKAWA